MRAYRAVIVGAPTYGKGIVQTTIGLDSNIAVRLTSGRWYAPSGRSFHRLRDSGTRDGGTRDRSAVPSERTDSVFRSSSGRVLAAHDGIIPDLAVAAMPPAGTERDALLRDPAVQQAIGALLPTMTHFTPSLRRQP